MAHPSLLTVIGTRPEIIKMSPLLPRFDAEFDHILVHSGQHYSANMDSLFFEDLELRRPDHMLGIGSHPPGKQTALILTAVEELIEKHRPAAVIVHGDTNTTLAGALAAAKYPDTILVHVEAGARSGNPKQAEEINRQIVDRVSDIHFVPYAADLENLQAERISTNNAFVTGNTVIASCLRISNFDGPDRFRSARGVEAGGYALATFHRQESVDDEEILSGICAAVSAIAEQLPVIASLHPRTRKMMQKYGITFGTDAVTVTEPVGYREMIALLTGARFCLTDSGGLMEEAGVLGVPALILRNETEHVRYIHSGIHELVGTDAQRIASVGRHLAQADDERARRAASTPANTEYNPVETILTRLASALA